MIEYQQYAQAGVAILAVYTAMSQAEAHILVSGIQIYSQAHVTLNQSMHVGQSQTHIFTPDVNQYAQACAWIAIRLTGLLFSDNFSRTTTAPPFNVGNADTGQQWRYVDYSNAQTEVNSTVYVDGSSLVFTNPYDSYNYVSINGPSSITEEGDLYFDIYIPTARQYNYYHTIYWNDKSWYFYTYDINSTQYGLYGYSSSVVTNVVRESWYRIHIKVDSLDGSSQFVKARIWKVGDAEPGTWTVIQNFWPYDALGSYYDYLGKPIVQLYTPYYYSASSVADYPSFKLDNVLITSTIYQMINYGAGNAGVWIKEENKSQPAQAQVILNQSMYVAQSQTHLLTTYPRYSQAQAFIRKLAGYAQAQARIPYSTDAYSLMVKEDGASHLYGLHTSNAAYNSEYATWQDEIGIANSSNNAYSYSSIVTPSPVGPEYQGILFNYYREYFQWLNKIDELKTTTAGVGTWTVETWVKSPPVTSVYSEIFEVYGGYSGSYRVVNLGFGSATAWSVGNYIRLAIIDTAGTTWHDTGILYTTNTWYHTAVTYNNGYFKVYINGQLTNEVTRTTWNTIVGSSLYLGYSSYMGYNTSTSIVAYDNLAIYPSELPQNRIQEHYARGNTQGFAQAQVLINRHWGLGQASWYIYDPTGLNHWQTFSQTQAHILALTSSLAQATVRITDAKDQNVYGVAQAVIIPEQGLLRYFIQGSSTNYSLPDQGTYAQITSMTAVTDPGQIAEGDYGSNYGIRWQAWFVADMSGAWWFQTHSDDGSGIFIYNEQNQLVGSMNNNYGGGQGGTTRNGTINLVAGTKYKIDVKHAEGGGGATMSAWYMRPGDTVAMYLLAGEAPWNDKSKLPVVRYWGMGLANALWVERNGAAFVWPNYAQAQTKIYYPALKGYGQAAVQIGAFWPAQSITRIAGEAPYEQEVETDLPGMYLKLRETSLSSPAKNQMSPINASYGSTVVLDQTGPLSSTSDSNSKAVYLDSNGNSIITVSNVVYQDTFTLELWAKSDNNTITIQTESTSGTAGTGGQRYIWNPSNSGSNGGLGVSLGTNGIAVYEHGSSYLPPLAVYSGAIGTSWRHIVITEYQKVAKIYLDGVLVRTGLTSTRGIIYSPPIIGRGDYGKYTGLVAEVAIYNYVLTDARILAHYTATQKGKQIYAQANVWAIGHPTATGQALWFTGRQPDGIYHELKNYGQAFAQILVHDNTGTGQAHALIQSDYGLTRMTWDNAAYVVGDIFSWGEVEGITLGHPNYSSSGNLPNPYPGASNWGMAWSGNFIADVTGTWQFRTTSDDGSDLWISNTRVVDNAFGGGHGSQSATGTIALVQGNFYTIHTRFGQGGGPWNISVEYKRPADSSWYFLTDNAPPWIRKYWKGAWGQALAEILPTPNEKQFAQAQAKLNSFNYPQRAQAKATILQTYRKYAQALAHVGWLRLAQAQARIIAFNVPKHASAKAHIKAYGVQTYAQAKAIIVHTAYSQGLAGVAVKQTYPFRYINPNYVLNASGTTVTPDPNFSLEGTIPENVLDGNPNSVWTNFLAIDTNEGIYFYLNLDLGTSRTISSYYILPVKYNVTANLQYSTNGSTWYDIVTGIYFDVGITSPIRYSDAITGEITPTNARYWRLKFVNGGDDNKVSIATFQLGTALTQNPTFGQAQAFFGKFGVAQALAYIAPGLSTNWAQAVAQIRQTYGASGNAQFWYLPPTAFGSAQAIIVQVYQLHGLAMAWALPPTVFGLSQVHILTTYQGRGQAKADIQATYGKYGAASVSITKSAGDAQATALIIRRNNPSGYAMVYIGHFVHGVAAAFIVKNKSYAQALAIIKQDYSKYSQALVLMRRSETYSQSRAWINRTYSVYGQSLVILNQYRRTANARTSCVRTYMPVANAKAHIHAIVSECSQAQVVVRRRYPYNYGQSRVLISIRSIFCGLAMAQVGAFKYANAQARIIAFNVPKAGLAACYTLVDINVPAFYPTSNQQSYLISYNNQTLPGYAQSEFLSSVARLSSKRGAYIDTSLIDYLGLENKEINLTMLIWEPTYLECKIRVQEAATILRTKRRTYNKLYIQQYDKYYEAMPRLISTQKSVGTSTRILEYEAIFDAKPWLISNELFTLQVGASSLVVPIAPTSLTATSGNGLVNLTWSPVSSTDSIETENRTLLDGGWTPTLIIVSGTDIAISGVTEYGEDTGSIAISGTVSNYVIDSDKFETSDNTRITPTDYGLYVGPGKTFFTITGATSCRIEYRNRWYI